MPLPDEVKKQVESLARDNKTNELVHYLKEQLTVGKTTARDVLDYARGYTWKSKPGQPYVIDAATINMLGLAVGKLNDKKQAKLKIEFYKLAAERGDSYGNRNYAQCLLHNEKTAKDALKFAENAVELAEGKANEEHEHKFIFCKALRVHNKWKEANIALMDFYQFKVKQLASAKNDDDKKTYQTYIEQALDLLNTIVNSIPYNFTTNDEVIGQNALECLEPILKCTDTRNEFLLIKQLAYYIQGRCHQALDNLPLAWQSYCQITDKASTFYADAVKARADVLKKQIRADLTGIPSVESIDLKSDPKSEDQIKKAKSLPSLLLPSGIPFPLTFTKSWYKEADWFDSANALKQQKKYDKRLKQIVALISAKEIEISLIKELLDNEENDEELTKNLTDKKRGLEKELEDLRSIQNELNQQKSKYSPSYRRIYRRHMAESRFFNPNRSKNPQKAQAIIDLASELIDQRFRVDNSKIPAVNLAGKSTRLWVKAEKAFQQAVVTLSSNDRPQLGIPRVENNRSSSSNFGPTELYKVSETKVKYKHRTSPKLQRLGDSFLIDHKAYNNDIVPYFNRITGKMPEKEKKLASIILRYGRTLETITLTELQSLHENAQPNDLDHFNQVCSLIMAREQSQWLSATSERHQLGMSVAQARCLIMIEAGFISFKEAFKNNPSFGIYSNTGIVDNPEPVAESCERIDKLYLAYLQNKHLQEHFKFLKKHIDAPRVPVLTREQAHKDLKYAYGGDSDSDGEGYDTDLSI